MKAQLQELFKGITESNTKINRITEAGKFWRVSFEDGNLGDMYITTRKAKDIAQEILTYKQGVLK